MVLCRREWCGVWIVVVVRDLCRGEETGVYIFPCFFVVYELGAGNAPSAVPVLWSTDPSCSDIPSHSDSRGLSSSCPSSNTYAWCTDTVT